MFSIPPLPAYDALHPLVVHFPIALLLLTPLLLLLGLLRIRDRSALALVTLLVLVLATAGAWLATDSGEAGEEAAEQVSAASEVFEQHEDGAELVFRGMLVISLLYAAFTVVLLRQGERFTSRAFIAVQLVFLVLTCAASLAIANVSHLGGRLVHEFGVRAPLGAAGTSAGAAGLGEDAEAGEYEADED